MIVAENPAFQDELIRDSLALIQFSAEWCGPCKKLTPLLSDFGFKHNILIVKVDVEAFPEVSSQYAVRALPTVVCVKNRQVQGVLVGLHEEKDYLALIEQANKDEEQNKGLEEKKEDVKA